MFSIKRLEKDDVHKVIAFELELRKQEPDTYYWEPDEAYRRQLEASFDNARFNTSMSFIAVEEDQVIGESMLLLSQAEVMHPAAVHTLSGSAY